MMMITKTISDVTNKSRIKVKVAIIKCINNKTSFIELENKEPTLKSSAVVLQILNLLWHLKKINIPPSCTWVGVKHVGA